MSAHIGDYVLHEPIGTGATATVFRATSETTGDTVAVKVIPEHDVDRFRPLAYALLQIDHPNAVRVRDIVDDGIHLAVVMDLIEGPTLDEWLRSGHRMRGPQVQSFTSAVVDAVRAAGRAGVVHGDVAPRNVMLSSRGPVLIDFGGRPGDANADVAAAGRLVDLLSRPGAVLPPSVTVERAERPPAPAAAATASSPRGRPATPRVRVVAAAVAAAIAVAVIAFTTFARPGPARAGEASPSGTRAAAAPGGQSVRNDKAVCATVRVQPGPDAGEKP